MEKHTNQENTNTVIYSTKYSSRLSQNYMKHITMRSQFIATGCCCCLRNCLNVAKVLLLVALFTIPVFMPILSHCLLTTTVTTASNTNTRDTLRQWPQWPHMQPQFGRSGPSTSLNVITKPQPQNDTSTSLPILPPSRTMQQQALQPATQQVPPQMQQQQQQQQLLTPQILAAPMNQYAKSTHELLNDLRRQMTTFTARFDDHFRNLLSSSKLGLHNMFISTYGLMYQQNTEIFTSMFESLEQYYATGQVPLTKSMENFFARLYQKVFQVYNSNKAFTSSYLDCATDQLASLRPFKDAPDKLIEEVRHAFVAARTFNQALNYGVDIIKGVISLGQPAQCNLINEKLLKNTQPASSANNQLARVPCTQFCEQVISRCIGRNNLEQLNERWRTYVIALAELAKKLSLHYNIGSVIGPLDVQISEAIMNFQENAPNISQQVFQVCGRPTQDLPLHHPKVSAQNRIGKRAAMANQPRIRQPAPSSINYHKPIENLSLEGNFRTSFRNNHGDGNILHQEDPASIGKKSLKLIDEIKNFMLSTKSFWQNIPTAVCTSNVTVGNLTSGLSRKSPNCYQEHLGLQDMNVDFRSRIEVRQLTSRLELIQSRISSAIDGVEIDWGNSDQKQTLVAPNVDTNQHNVRPFVPVMIPTTTTTTTPEPTSEDDLGEDDEAIDSGSGNGEELDQNHRDQDSEFHTDLDDNSDDTSDHSTEVVEETDYPDTDAPNEETTSPSPSDVSSEQNTNIPDNSIDLMDQKPPITADMPNDLIIADQGAQRSSASHSVDLMLSNQYVILISLLAHVVIRLRLTYHFG